MRARGRRRAGSRALGHVRRRAFVARLSAVFGNPGQCAVLTHAHDHLTRPHHNVVSWSRRHLHYLALSFGFQEKCNGESLSGPHSELERYSLCHIGPRFFFPFMFRLRCFAYITGATRRARASLLLSVEFFQLGNARCTLAMHHCECFHETSQPLTAFSLGAPRSDIFLPPETGLRNTRVSHVRKFPWQNFFPVH
jgi:hypothetical protein